MDEKIEKTDRYGIDPGRYGPRREDAQPADAAGITGIGGGLMPVRPSYREAENRAMTQYDAYLNAFDTIERAESRHGKDPYNQVGDRSSYGRKTKDGLTDMTIDQVTDWIGQTDGTNGKAYDPDYDRTYVGPFQIGRTTLHTAVKRMGLSRSTKFSPAIQKYIAMDLIDNRAREATTDPGVVDPNLLANRLAAEWAGLARPDGKSYYDGRAGNRANVSRAETEAIAAGLINSGIYRDRAARTYPELPVNGPLPPHMPDWGRVAEELPDNGPTPTKRPDRGVF